MVADDLASMVRDELPGARVLVAATVEAAEEVLRGEKPDIAFVNLPPTEPALTDLVVRLEGMAVTVVLMEARPETSAAARRFIEMPFLRSAVAEELRAVLRRMTG